MSEKPMRRVIRAKGATEWRVMWDDEMTKIELANKGEESEVLHARMARFCGIEGPFEIEVQESKHGVWARQRGAEGDTSILPVPDPYDDMT